MKMIIKTFCAASLTLGVVLSAKADGLLEVKQTIFGMDCAPCAYGVQQRLKKLPGITQVDVSLNDGIASIAVAPDSPVTLVQIHDVLVDGGFTPKQALVTVVGHLTKDGARWILVSGGSRYSLVIPSSAPFTPQVDARVQLQGTVSEPAAGAPELEVTSGGSVGN